MDPTRNGGDTNDFSDSDQAWWDRLGGKPDAAATSPSVKRAQREADALKRALALDRETRGADPQLAQALSDEAREQRWQQLQFRLRREGLAESRTPWLRRAGLGAALAAGVLLAVVLLPRLGQDSIYYDEPPVMRGEFEVVRVADTQPKLAAEQLATALRSAGQSAALHQRAKIFSVDIVVSGATPPAALELLRRTGAKALAGPLRIEFAPR